MCWKCPVRVLGLLQKVSCAGSVLEVCCLCSGFTNDVSCAGSVLEVFRVLEVSCSCSGLT